MDGKVKLYILMCALANAVHHARLESRKIPMKIVDEPSQYGFNFNSNNNAGPDSSSLKVRVDPSPFSGPAHLRRLMGKCYNMTTNDYKYELCPFANVTQHEQSLRWNPYSGVLGVWQEWEIVNNSFVALVMRNGDDCGSAKRREVKVVLKCGKKEKIEDVSEPHTCSYLLTFKTQLVCHNHSLLVYPVLNESLRHEWDAAYTNYHYGYTTSQGYNKAMKKIFQKAGFYQTDEKKIAATVASDAKAQTEEHRSNDQFLYLPTCNLEYVKLKQENEKLKEELLKLKSQLQSNATMNVDSHPSNTTTT